MDKLPKVTTESENESIIETARTINTIAEKVNEIVEYINKKDVTQCCGNCLSSKVCTMNPPCRDHQKLQEIRSNP